jgi:ATP-dependent helicase YprA (DUF1998 family)
MADRQPAVKSAIEGLRIAAALLCSTDPDDLGVHVHANADSSEIVAYLADNEAGGSGLTENVFNKARELLEGALRILSDCPHCKSKPESRGCPGCVTTPWGGQSDVFRQGGIILLQRLLGALD